MSQKQKKVLTHQRKTGYRSHTIGYWMPKDPKIIKQWLEKLKTKADLDPKSKKLEPLIIAFKNEVEKDATLHMQYTQMFTEATESKLGHSLPPVHVETYQQMFYLVNYIMTHYTPPYSRDGLVGFPINAILNWAMGTKNGYAAFLNKKANDFWMQVINKWQNDLLKTPFSLHVLNYDDRTGWLGRDAMSDMTEGGDTDTFVGWYICEPSRPHFGFGSWDDFFTRRFREGTRPIEDRDDPFVINNVCESFPYALRENVQLIDEFWIKDHKYSLQHLFGPDMFETAERFVGGTVYQAFLSALSYHRWHSPVDGTVIATKNIPGTYYSSSLCVGPDSAAPDKSQGYICQVATRSIIVIEADNPSIGLMCVVAVGMAEVSTCEITVNPRDYVQKGQEIGMFHFGGSTHCLIFGPDVRLQFIDRVYTDLDDDDTNDSDGNIWVNAKLAKVVDERSKKRHKSILKKVKDRFTSSS